MAVTLSSLFNEAYYLSQNTDVANAVKAGIFSSGQAHWEQYGKFEGRPFSAAFNPTVYAANNPDLATAGLTTPAQLTLHYVQYGIFEGRSIFTSAQFDASIYASQNPDLGNNGITDPAALYQHFVTYGIDENRVASGFDGAAYLAANKDLADYLAAGNTFGGYTGVAAARYHYYHNGIAEGRPFPTANPSYAISAASTTLTEGNETTFTVTSSVIATADTTLTFNIVGDTNGGTIAAASAADFTGLTGTVTIAAGSTTGTFKITAVNDQVAEGLEGFKISLFDAALKAVTLTGSTVFAVSDRTDPVGQTLTLTGGIDTLVGGAGNDTIVGGNGSSLISLDSVDGGAGNDIITFVTTDDVSVTAGAKVLNVETATITTTGAVAADVKGWTGLTAVTATGGKGVSVVADTTVNVSATSTAAGANNLSVTGGKAVTATAAARTTGTIKVADAAGAVTVNSTGASTGDITITGATSTVTVTNTSSVNGNAGAVNVTGGTTVTVSNLASNDVNTTTTLGTTTVTGTSATTSVTVKQSAAATASASVAGVVNGAVSVQDANAGDTTKAGTITSVTLENYGGTLISSNALANLSLKGGNAAVDVTNALTTPTVTTLNVALNGVTGGTLTDTAGAYTKLNLSTATAAAKLTNVAAANVKTLTVSGSAALELASTAGLTSLDTVTVSGSGGVKADFSGKTVTAVDASASSGANTVTVDATKATYKGGSGVDTVTIAAAPTKAIDGGAGTSDVLVVNFAGNFDAAANTNVTGFEVLSLGTSAGGGSYNATGFTSLRQGAVTGAVTYSNVAAGVGLTLTASPGFNTSYVLKDASGKSDSLALTLTSDNALAAGNITASGIETIAITNTDTNATAHTNTIALTAADATSITVTGNAGLVLTNTTAVAVTNFDASGVTGKAADAAALGVTYTSAYTGSSTVTIKGGIGNDVLTGNTKNDVITGNDGNDTIIGGGGNDSLDGGAGNDVITAGNGNSTIVGGAGNDTITAGNGNYSISGGEGNDTITAGNGAHTIDGGAGTDTITIGTGLAVVTGGAGSDTFVLNAPNANGNIYATITDFAKDSGSGASLVPGDSINLSALSIGGAVTNTTLGDKVSLAGTAAFADYLNAAASDHAAAATNAVVTWFQFAGDTYLVVDNNNDNVFVSSPTTGDQVVKLTGLIDLSGVSITGEVLQPHAI